jgi:hypothetical protein
MATTKNGSATKPTAEKLATTKKPATKTPAPAPKVAQPSSNGARVTRARDHLSDAAGLAFVKDGFAFSKEQDVLFALGWPHLRWLVDGHPDDATPTDDELMKVCQDGGVYGLVWPRGMANRFVRGFAASSDDATNSSPKWALPALGDATDVRAEEGPRLVQGLFGPERYNDGFVEHFVFLLEAMHGTDAVLDWILSAFEGMKTPPPRDEEACALATSAGLLLLRVPTAASRAAKARLGKLAKTIQGDSLREFLRSAIGGGEAAKAKKIAGALLKTRADYARPILEKAATGKGGDTNKKALALIG